MPVKQTGCRRWGKTHPDTDGIDVMLISVAKYSIHQEKKCSKLYIIDMIISQYFQSLVAAHLVLGPMFG